MIATRVRGPVIAGLARCNDADIDRAGCGPLRRRRAAASTSSSPPRTCTSSASCGSRASSASTRPSARHRARRYTDDVQFSAEDATRSDMDFLCRVVEAVISAGCTTVNLPDTVGYSTPDEIGAFFRTILSRVPNAGHASSARTATTTSGWPSPTRSRRGGGARQVECTINGIGERAGNASLEEIVMATRVRATAARSRPASTRASSTPRASC
jgi:2-isopropylmalate synthase